MDIVVYIHDSIEGMESSSKILTLLEKCELKFELERLLQLEGVNILNVVGEKIRKFPHVVIDGERVGGYYDLVEYLMNKDIINYANEPQWKKNN